MLKVYQFYHDETKNDGEYILLSDEETFLESKYPKLGTSTKTEAIYTDTFN
jgi:hypothetical protein